MTQSCYRCGAVFESEVLRRKCENCRRPTAAAHPIRYKAELTFREKQLTALVAQGHANKEISARLFLSEGTIKEYLHRIFERLRYSGVPISNRTELAVWWLTHAKQPEPPHSTD